MVFTNSHCVYYISVFWTLTIAWRHERICLLVHIPANITCREFPTLPMILYVQNHWSLHTSASGRTRHEIATHLAHYLFHRMNWSCFRFKIAIYMMTWVICDEVFQNKRTLFRIPTNERERFKWMSKVGLTEFPGPSAGICCLTFGLLGMIYDARFMFTR